LFSILLIAHGGFGSAHCTKCGKEHSQEYCRERLFDLKDGKRNEKGEIIPWCMCSDPKCKGNVKPDIVFYGEALPERFDELRGPDLEDTDLLIIAGTSLKVYPFAATKDLCNPKAPRLLINLEVI
jgi:NAD-dependent SIR2 family protein deacetylase